MVLTLHYIFAYIIGTWRSGTYFSTFRNLCNLLELIQTWMLIEMIEIHEIIGTYLNLFFLFCFLDEENAPLSNCNSNSLILVGKREC